MTIIELCDALDSLGLLGRARRIQCGEVVLELAPPEGTTEPRIERDPEAERADKARALERELGIRFPTRPG